jgi:hypothetical protein
VRPAIILAFTLPLVLAACDNSPKPPATQQGQQPATQQPAAQAPAAQKPAASQVPLGDAAMAPLVGSWATDASACGAPIAITAASFNGAENSCDITGWTDNKDGTYTAALSCGGNTESITMTPLFGPSGEGIRLDYVDRKSTATVFRCPTPKAQ